MKTSLQLQSPATRGVALVIVLAMLVLLSGLLVAFMTAVTTEHNSTNANANAVATRQIAENTTNLVIAQIREATTRYTESATWSSQPGAIRVLSGKAGGKITMPPENGYQYEYVPGKDDWVYKLYSSEQMKVKAADYQPGSSGMQDEIDVIGKWAKPPDSRTMDPRYVDLNEPVLTPRSDLNAGDKQYVDPRYPIIDPRASFDKDEKRPASASTPGIVEGFAAMSTNFLASSSKVLTVAGQTVPSLAMPAQWLYVLRDGSILGPLAVTALGTKLETNPIVGRTAFWVDDESCKVNVNTASEGTFWDTPVVSTEQDSGNVASNGPVTSSTSSLSLAASQPARGEYQRYSGHPATTCLSPVLGWLWNTNGVSFPVTTLPSDANLMQFKNAIYKISPFTPSGLYSRKPPLTALGIGTSLASRDNPDDGRPDGNGVTALTDGTLKLTILDKHLYANTDEFIFQPNRNSGGASPTALVNDPDEKLMTPQALEKVRCFLTANSRAPELNIFNRPRVTVWPVSQTGPKDPGATTRRTTFDTLFEFTSKIGGAPFNLTRFYARDATTDINATQNKSMLKYLQWLTGDNGRDIPGFGGKFSTKYSYTTPPLVTSFPAGLTERDQILALMFDYTRSVNLVDTGTGKIGTNRFISYTPFFGLGQAGYGGVVARSYDWSGQVTPARTLSNPLGDGLQGLGRFAVIKEAALVFTRAGDVVGGVQKSMQATLLFEMATPMPGYPAIRQTFWTRVRAITPPKMKVGANSTDVLPTGGAWDNITNISSHEVGFGRAFMPTLGFINQIYYYPEHKNFTYPELYPNDPNFNVTDTIVRKNFARDQSTEAVAPAPPKGYQRNKSVTFYPYVSDLAPIPTGVGTFDLVGGSFEVEIYAGEAPTDPRSTQPVQTITLRFPTAAALNVPTGQGATKAEFGLRPTSPSTNKDDTSWNPFRGTDVVRSVEYLGSRGNPPITLPANQGADLRIAQMRARLIAEDYGPRDPVNYAKANVALVHGFHWGHGDQMPGFDPNANPSYMAANGTYRGNKPFLLPVGVKGVIRSDGGPGDYDRGISKHMDYAGGNKVDEGNVYFGYGDNDDGGRLPYFRGRGIEEVGKSFFTPNRQLPSAVMFGSLPSGGLEGKPWQTLLFHPDRPAGGNAHPGASLPEDHLLLDLFHLPIIEPYAISEPFSTAGKINLNYIMAPYGYAPGAGTFGKDNVPNSYIRRDTGLRAVLKAVKILAVDTNAADCAHSETPVRNGSTSSNKYRFDIDLDNTIAKIEKRLTDPKRGVFRSASEICTVDLYPAGKTVTTWGKFWETDNAQTGDNMRERPYAHIYPRVTTKSNVFTVHMRCQTIRQARRQTGETYEFDAKRDQVVGEYRGSSIVERFVDPNDPALAGYNYESKDAAKPGSVDPYYRFRVVNTKQFAPR